MELVQLPFNSLSKSQHQIPLISQRSALHSSLPFLCVIPQLHFNPSFLSFVILLNFSPLFIFVISLLDFSPLFLSLTSPFYSSQIGIPGSIFIHAGGFIGGHATKEGALQMAIQVRCGAVCACAA
jgi:Uncharacterised protein family (UPF0160)